MTTILKQVSLVLLITWLITSCQTNNKCSYIRGYNIKPCRFANKNDDINNYHRMAILNYRANFKNKI